jgi:cytochrome c oxidase assembly protein subunit 15
LGLLVYTWWFALRLVVQKKQMIFSPSSKKLLGWIIGLLVLQLAYGAFMAGLKAATAAPTWPSINGSYLPAGISSFQGKEGTFFSALVNNPVTIHFIHRNLAYVLTILIAIWVFRAAKNRGSALLNKVRWTTLLLVVLQVTLGIAAVLTSLKKVPQKWGVFEWNAQLHQVVAMLLLLSLVTAFFLSRVRPVPPGGRAQV